MATPTTAGRVIIGQGITVKGDIKNCEEVIVRGFFDAGNVEAKTVVVEADGEINKAEGGQRVRRQAGSKEGVSVSSQQSNVSVGERQKLSRLALACVMCEREREIRAFALEAHEPIKHQLLWLLARVCRCVVIPAKRVVTCQHRRSPLAVVPFSRRGTNNTC